MLEKVKEVLVEAINVDEDMITMEANLKDDLGIDSLAAVELSLELETAFDVRIEDEELEKLVTVADIVKLLESKQLPGLVCLTDKDEKTIPDESKEVDSKENPNRSGMEK